MVLLLVLFRVFKVDLETWFVRFDLRLFYEFVWVVMFAKCFNVYF